MGSRRASASASRTRRWRGWSSPRRRKRPRSRSAEYEQRLHGAELDEAHPLELILREDVLHLHHLRLEAGLRQALHVVVTVAAHVIALAEAAQALARVGD